MKQLLLVAIASVSLILALMPQLGFFETFQNLERGYSWRHGRELGRLRSLYGAQKAYASMNGSYFDSIRCLRVPADCLPGRPTSAPALLDSNVSNAFDQTRGYSYTYHPGPAPTSLPLRFSHTSVMAFAVTTIWTNGEDRKFHNFCMDSTDRLFVYRSDSIPSVTEGRCSENALFKMKFPITREDFDVFYATVPRQTLTPTERLLNVILNPWLLLALAGTCLVVYAARRDRNASKHR